MDIKNAPPAARLQCEHCGETCAGTDISLDGKIFCCQGCQLVYELLNENGLCAYYTMNSRPGVAQRIPVRKDKFAFLEDEKIQQQLVQFRDDRQTHVTFYIPHIHCSSCLWLLEHLHRLDAGIQRVTVNFARKEAQVIFLQSQTSLRRVAETLAGVGYEPYISLQDLRGRQPRTDRGLIYRLGVAGCCFGNIMLLSFPEYFSGHGYTESLNHLFRWLNLLLSLPVLLYSAQVFYRSAWKGLKHGFLNIDVPIVLAIMVTFVRSLADVLSGHGAGYFDSMTGIVFFMLTGRVLQERTYRGLSFDRDYTAYFPIAVTVIKHKQETPVALPDIQANDTLLIHNNELIPADGILVKGTAVVDYSFVTGESAPVRKLTGEIVYAGGRQLEGNIEVLTIKPVAQSYLTSLWNRNELKQDSRKPPSFIHLLGRYFTLLVLWIAVVTATWWWVYDPSRIWPSVTAILIIACPCALLLAATFTNGHVLRILGRQRLYLRNAAAIERLANVDHIVFDKTGTLTGRAADRVSFSGTLTQVQKAAVAALAAQSTHPLSRMVLEYCSNNGDDIMDPELTHSQDIMDPGPAHNQGTMAPSPEQNPPAQVTDFRSAAGQGISGQVNGHCIKLGSAAFTGDPQPADQHKTTGSVVFVAIDDRIAGYFTIRNNYRPGIQQLLQNLQQHYRLSLLSGDNDREAAYLRQLMGPGAVLRFAQQPQDKLDYILSLQKNGERVLMIGDGLNDAGALKQSDIGISLAESSNNFTPASDGILEAAQLPQLPRFIRICKANKRIILLTFAISLLYNITGLFFAVQGLLSPLTAAILMPASSISIVLLTYVLSERAGRS